MIKISQNSNKFCNRRFPETKTPNHTPPRVKEREPKQESIHIFQFLELHNQKNNKNKYAQRLPKSEAEHWESKQTCAKEIQSFTPRISSWICKFERIKLP